MIRKTVFLLILLILFSVTLAMAVGRPNNLLFNLIDTDRNGLISEQEWHAFMQKRFESIDTNHDQNISRAELDRYRQKLRSRLRSNVPLE